MYIGHIKWFLGYKDNNLCIKSLHSFILYNRIIPIFLSIGNFQLIFWSHFEERCICFCCEIIRRRLAFAIRLTISSNFHNLLRQEKAKNAYRICWPFWKFIWQKLHHFDIVWLQKYIRATWKDLWTRNSQLKTISGPRNGTILISR